jgi:hypothetical protein
MVTSMVQWSQVKRWCDVALLIALLILVVLDMLALRFGFDSRNTRSGGLSASWRTDVRR